MRRLLIAATFALATVPMLAASGSAAPRTTSDLLRPQTPWTQVWCKRYCANWGWCGHGYKRYRCCKHWVCH
jgi:hypothetical protein